MKINKVKELGQVFTPNSVVADMLGLIRNNGKVLEPSCGNGQFSERLKSCVAIELDASVCPRDAINMDFFSYSLDNKFSTIIGNPPYVKYSNICKETKSKLDYTYLDRRANLYLHFIYKCFLHLDDGGELIFIIPRELFKATSALKLNKLLYDNGTITHYYDLGDSRIFDKAIPNVIIVRYEKGNLSHRLEDGRYMLINNGLIFITTNIYTTTVSSYCDVKVGAVSGADKIFRHRDGTEFVYSKTVSTGKTVRMLYNQFHQDLLPYKDKLLNRGIKNFNEDNWWQWGRTYHKTESDRIYVNCKTRYDKPFFIHECKAYDGSVLALFPHKGVDINMLKTMLNKNNWEDLGYVCDGRYLFTQYSLLNSFINNI